MRFRRRPSAVISRVPKSELAGIQYDLPNITAELLKVAKVGFNNLKNLSGLQAVIEMCHPVSVSGHGNDFFGG